MIPLAEIGSVVDIHPLAALRHEMDLVYFDGPVLSLFRNNAGDGYLYYWCDSDADHNRWLVFRPSKELLAAYVNRRTTLLDVIRKASDSLVYFADIDGTMTIARVAAVAVDEVPIDYLPPEGARYDSQPVNVDLGLNEFAELLNSDVLNVHLQRGEDVEFGAASITTLGPVLAATGRLSEAIAVKQYASNIPGQRRVTKKIAKRFGTLQYVTERAASFSAILRPLIPEIALPGFYDRPGRVIEILFDLINRGQNYDDLKAVSRLYGDEVMQALALLMETIKASSLDLRYTWVDVRTKERTGTAANVVSADAIYRNIRRLELEGADVFTVNGLFTALDTKKRTYSFEAADRMSYSGKIAEAAGPLERITFDQRYVVEIGRTVLAGPAHRRRTVVNTITKISLQGMFDETRTESSE